MNDQSAVWEEFSVVGGALLLVLAIWMLLTLAAWITRRRVNLLLFAVQLLGLLYLLRDAGLPLARATLRWGGGVEARAFLTACIVISAAFLLDRLWRHFVWDGVLPAFGRAPPPRLARGCFTAAVMLLAAALVIGWVYGQSVTGLIAASGVVAIVLGYAAQSVLSDLLAGMSMAASPMFKIGDVLEIDGGWYEVVDQNWRVTETIGRDGRRVYWPNSDLVKRPVANITGQGDPLRHPFAFSVDPGVPPALVREAVDAALAQAATVDRRRAHVLGFAGWGEWGQEVTLHYFTVEANYWPSRPEVANLLWYEFRRRGIGFGYNRMQTHMTDWRRAEAAHDDALIGAEAEAAEFTAAARAVEEFAGLTDDQLSGLRDIARPRVYGRFERMIEAGAASGSVFLLVRGEMDAFVTLPDGAESKVAAIEAPSLVGFMALAMGQPRSATLRAGEASLAYEIDAADFAAFAAADPAVMERLVETSAAMALANERSREEGAGAADDEDRLTTLRNVFRARLADLIGGAK